MPQILTQYDLRQVQKLSFCYLCGKEFEQGAKLNRDHVPPRSIFAKTDRNPPLILPTHVLCNTKRSDDDEIAAQMFSVLHGKYPKPERTRLAFDLFGRGSELPMIGLRDIPFRRMVFRMVRGFHAALYGSYVTDQGGMIYAPLPAHNMVNGELQAVHDDPGRYALTLAFKKERNQGQLDRVVCFNGKCVYECVWLRFDDGRPFCLFALRLYDWENIGDHRLGPKRGCLGWYHAEVPSIATIGRSPDVTIPNDSPLDPFAM